MRSHVLSSVSCVCLKYCPIVVRHKRLVSRRVPHRRRSDTGAFSHGWPCCIAWPASSHLASAGSVLASAGRHPDFPLLTLLHRRVDLDSHGEQPGSLNESASIVVLPPWSLNVRRLFLLVVLRIVPASFVTSVSLAYALHIHWAAFLQVFLCGCVLVIMLHCECA